MVSGGDMGGDGGCWWPNEKFEKQNEYAISVDGENEWPHIDYTRSAVLRCFAVYVDGEIVRQPKRIPKFANVNNKMNKIVDDI